MEEQVQGQSHLMMGHAVEEHREMSSHTTMAKKRILVILVCTVLVLLSWFLNMHKLTIPKDQTRIKVYTPISSAPVKSALSARPYLPSNETIRKMSDVELEELYYTYVENMDVLCTKKIRLGNSGDGGWDVCDDEEYRPRPPCVVYSFGINNDFTFDDAVLSTYGCEVHSFDPSMKGEVKRPDRMFFYKIGIGEKDFVNTKGMDYKTLTSIKAQLNHTKVNILKMDIESDEYKALPNIMESGELDVSISYSLKSTSNRKAVEDRQNVGRSENCSVASEPWLSVSSTLTGTMLVLD
ncbi:methyltransferase-like protein 24 isoform X2 [Pomacea canaliculata]|uniref:methyltransferase-like protein 24 isoform X2 n=1 Tax=Pomacea canaliculata TaxID=400727 RepID=UPI000D72EF80|nr:methyltransferase-like protein 24 isoform X2 [Pomacea canaliculata]XP_025098919.1 methyltransferase-like protein 24 isoform X2 [Pomacea canaliculata]XP_025098920.1 methyltransferase-like protein 24 isoform X2 [Pomacea canaliculata]XP_025098921.1 methyltransferase-like protein 24 isoform X2 [Pomacea canaliculata]XP_025098922.1 methyltransferase-like protein 24 isoform X2 [Pomacea canaliculata]